MMRRTPVDPHRTVRVGLEFQLLEDRCLPVVGALTPAPIAPLGSGFDGVALVQSPNGGTNTGTLLYTGQHILTAAHSVDFDGDHRADGSIPVRLDLPEGRREWTIDPAHVTVSAGWTGLVNGSVPSSGHDWAIITLPEEAPPSADRYDLYRGNAEVGQTFILAGYGSTGVGLQGHDLSTVGYRRTGSNHFDGTALNIADDRVPPGLALIADFDSGLPTNDAYGGQVGTQNLGLGNAEAMIGPGDSGSPAFIRQGNEFLIAGVASFAVAGGGFDVDWTAHGRVPSTNNSFGEYFAYTRVSAFTSEIDAILTGTSPNDPTPSTPTAGDTGGTPNTSAPTSLQRVASSVHSSYRPIGIGSDQGALPEVKLASSDGTVILQGLAYSSSFRGGVRVASADVTGDGIVDLVTVPGLGLSTEVNVFDGVTGQQAMQFTGFESAFRGGAFVTASDLNGDGRAEIILSPDQGGGPRVRVVDGATGAVRADFLGIEDPSFRGGARLGTADLNGDGVDELLVGAGYGGGPRVAVFDGRALGDGIARKLVDDFFVFEPSLRNGVYLDGGRINADGFAEIAVAGGPGGGPRVLVLDGSALLASNARRLQPVANFFAGDPTSRGGVRVSVVDMNGDGSADVIAGAGEDGGSGVRTYFGNTLAPNSTPSSALSFEAFDQMNGVFVG